MGRLGLMSTLSQWRRRLRDARKRNMCFHQYVACVRAVPPRGRGLVQYTTEDPCVGQVSSVPFSIRWC